MSLPPIATSLAQLLAAALGGLAFHIVGVPVAWLSGAVIATVLWNQVGPGRPMAKPLTDAAMLISGATMGAGATPEAIAAMARYPLSLVTLVVGLFAIAGASVLWLTRVSGWRRDDAVLASVPGALSTVLAIAADRNADVASIAIVQSLRLFVLVTLLPSAVVLVGGGDGTMLLGQGQPVTSAWGLALVLLGGLAVGQVFARFGLAAPILLGATVVSTIAHATSLAPGAVPPVIATAGLVLIGVFVAESFRSASLPAMRRVLPAALGSFAIGMTVAALFAGIASSVARANFADALVAFAPGGLEAMMVVALALGLDPLYVGVHHLARFLGLGIVLPVLVAWLQRDDRPSQKLTRPRAGVR